MDLWLDALRARLPGHASLLDDRIRVLELQCSIACGAGDQLSDLDLGVAARDDAWEQVADDLPDRLRAIAETVDLLAHTMPEWGGRPQRRLFVQYADGRQIDVVVQAASAVSGRVPGAVVHYEPDGRLAEQRVPSVATASVADVRTWEVLGWESLANVAKYLECGSAWEALERLTQARNMALRLCAAAEDVPYPLFGLTSLLDADPPRLPDGLDATASRADLDELRAAGRACAELLRVASARAREHLDSNEVESPWPTGSARGSAEARAPSDRHVSPSKVRVVVGARGVDGWPSGAPSGASSRRSVNCGGDD